MLISTHLYAFIKGDAVWTLRHVSLSIRTSVYLNDVGQSYIVSFIHDSLPLLNEGQKKEWLYATSKCLIVGQVEYQLNDARKTQDIYIYICMAVSA